MRYGAWVICKQMNLPAASCGVSKEYFKQKAYEASFEEFNPKRLKIISRDEHTVEIRYIEPEFKRLMGS
ncbi:hypothetical protein [Candidatus Hakubella thermalkaliphila]|uniref:hypothetical protein n=2 Tax=Candidatus Hakubella thermalkaliphila TaxID=2754717 RepID=UPI001C615641|nr:hypothetical protein [Candidatus Hakubella thermalkaliphila]